MLLRARVLAGFGAGMNVRLMVYPHTGSGVPRAQVKVITPTRSDD
jgi:hypothetical protein